MEMEVMHFLSAIASRVAQQPIAALRVRPTALLKCQAGHQGHHMAQQFGVLRADLCH
jgi:hypothetical protein